MLFYVSSFYSYVTLCFFLISPSLTLFFVLITLSLSLSVFPYVIFCFFLPSPSHSLFYCCDLCSKQQSTVGRKQFKKRAPKLTYTSWVKLANWLGWKWARISVDENRLNANHSDLVFCNGVLICDSCLWFYLRKFDWTHPRGCRVGRAGSIVVWDIWKSVWI